MKDKIKNIKRNNIFFKKKKNRAIGITNLHKKEVEIFK